MKTLPSSLRTLGRYARYLRRCDYLSHEVARGKAAEKITEARAKYARTGFIQTCPF